MDSPRYRPSSAASSSRIVSDHHGENQGNDASSDYDDDGDEGEPPSLSPHDDDVPFVCTSNNQPIRLMTMVGPPHCRLKPRRSRRSDRYRFLRGVGVSSRFAIIAAILAVLLCHVALCVAQGAANDNLSSIYKDAARDIPDVMTEESPMLRGAIHRPDTISEAMKLDASSSASCNYECCLASFDIAPLNDGRNAVENVEGANSIPMNDMQQWSGASSDVRMLQASSSTTASNTANTTANPCPSANDKSEEGGGVGIPIAVQYILIVILVLFSALFSGLTLGLMSLDPSGLEIVMANSDDPRMARAAKAIYPVRLNGNLLLCTLLLGNVGVNSMLSILMADLTSGLVGFIVSTAVIVIFGEIIPQALCSRFALQVGEKTVPLVKFIMVLLYPICKPLSVILNKVLGHEIGTTYSTSEMAKLIEIHVQRGELEGATGAAMTGALRYRSVEVREVMTPLVNTFMLSADERLGFDTVAKIFKTGYSRIPVYEVSMSNIIGLLFVKDLIFLDPEDEIPVKNFVQIFGRGLHVIWPDDKLGDVLKLLKRGRSHMALVRDVNDGDGKVDPYYEIKGIITLEDIIEIILGDEIVDETDELVDVNDPESVVRRSDIGEYIEGALEKSSGRDSPVLGGGVSNRSSRAIDWEARLRLLDERLVDEHLSTDEVRAVAAHLKTNYSKAVELISDRQLKEVLSLIPVTEIPPASTCDTVDGGDDSGVPTDTAELIYERGVPAEFCAVVLAGKIMVMSGADKFRSDVSNWGVLASRALTDPSYVPDFSAWVVPNQNGSGGCRCVKLDRKSYYDAVDNTALEKTDHHLDNTPTALANSATITNESPLALNGDTDNISHSQRTLGSPLRIDSKKNDTLLHPPASPQPPVIPANDIHVEHTKTAYVRTNSQEKTHSRRSKLLKAFSRASKKTEKE